MLSNLIDLIYDLLHDSVDYEVVAISSLAQELVDLSLYNASNEFTLDFSFFCVGYLTMLSESILYSINVRMIMNVEQYVE
jgi:hypothetical protein